MTDTTYTMYVVIIKYLPYISMSGHTQPPYGDGECGPFRERATAEKIARDIILHRHQVRSAVIEPVQIKP